MLGSHWSLPSEGMLTNYRYLPLPPSSKFNPQYRPQLCIRPPAVVSPHSLPLFLGESADSDGTPCCSVFCGPPQFPSESKPNPKYKFPKIRSTFYLEPEGVIPVDQ